MRQSKRSCVASTWNATQWREVADVGVGCLDICGSYEWRSQADLSSPKKGGSGIWQRKFRKQAARAVGKLASQLDSQPTPKAGPTRTARQLAMPQENACLWTKHVSSLVVVHIYIYIYIYIRIYVYTHISRVCALALIHNALWMKWSVSGPRVQTSLSLKQMLSWQL